MPNFKIPLNQFPIVVADLISQQFYNVGNKRALAILARLSTFHRHAVSLLYGYNVKREGSSAVVWAAYYGRIGTLKLLLRYHADMESPATGASEKYPYSTKSSCLVLAAYYGHFRMVEFLLSQPTININAKHMGETTLSYAVASGQEKIIALLLAKDGIDVNASAPLVAAVRKKQLHLLKMLLARDDIKVDAISAAGETAMEVAAHLNLVEMSRMLLENGAEPGLRLKRGRHHQGPLRIAIEDNSFEVAEFLLENANERPDLDTPNEEDETPLYHASDYLWNRHDDRMLRLLLTHGADPNERRAGGGALFASCVAAGATELVKLLLEKGANPNLGDCYGWAPLSHLADYKAFTGRGTESEFVKIARLLLASGALPDAACNEGRTLLSYMCNRPNNTDCIKKFLDIAKVDLNSQCILGLTPLSYAVQCGHNSIVEFFLSLDGISPNLPCHKGLTPLAYAAAGERQDVVRMLLDSNAVDPNSPDKHGRVPLYHGVMRNRGSAWHALLDNKGVDPELPCHDGRTVFSYAVEQSTISALQMLLKSGKVNPNSTCKRGRTPLSYAAERGRCDVVGFLLGDDRVDINQKCKIGWTPWKYASVGGHPECCKVLASHKDHQAM